MNNTSKIVLGVLFAIVVIFLLVVAKIISNMQVHEDASEETSSIVVQKEKELTRTPREIFPTDQEGLVVNRPIPLSGLSKAQVLDIRKKYVQQSIFKDDFYEPSMEVFGAIEDGKPWMATNICSKSAKIYPTKGPSEESRFICNPTMLVAIEFPFGRFNKSGDTCTNDVSNLVPQHIAYDASKKEIQVTYQKLPFDFGHNYFYTFNGLNARDFGYKYATLDTPKTTYPLDFTQSTNISNSVITFQNYIHLGGSCGVSGGCNNGSPRQEYLEFLNDKSTGRGGEILVKLWKEMPPSADVEPDIYEKITILE